MESVKELLDNLNSFFTNMSSQLEEKKQEFSEQLNSIESRINLDMNNVIKTVQEKEHQIKELNDKVNENNFNESNYTKVSFIKQQDKEIQELRNILSQRIKEHRLEQIQDN